MDWSSREQSNRNLKLTILTPANTKFAKAHHSRYSFCYGTVMLWWTAQTSGKICRPTHGYGFCYGFYSVLSVQLMSTEDVSV